jgi:murein DD-endopeptidase MepM/ murein hydrolase activator NlpD/muramidase (phage lysozyme)
MAVETPNRSAISPLRFFNRTARVNQQGPAIDKEKLTQIDYSLKGIISIKERSSKISKIKEEESKRQEKEKRLEAGKFFVSGAGKLASAIPGKNTIQRFLIFMAFGWLFNTFSKYFGELGGPLGSIIGASGKIIDVFSQVAFSIFTGFATFVDLGYKAWDVMRGVESPEKFQGALNDMIVSIDTFFGGLLQQLGIVQGTEPSETTPGVTPQTTPGAPPAAAPGNEKPGYSGPPTPQAPPTTPGAPPAAAPGNEKPGYSGPPTPQYAQPQVTGGIVPSQSGDRITSAYGAQEPGLRKEPHTGIDYGYPAGTQISLIKSGVVVEASKAYNGGYGNFILIQHSDGKYSMFNHLQDIYVQKGQKINASEGNAPVIGTIGNTGYSTGDHLDFKVATKWDGYNPSGFINPTSYQDSIFRIGGDVTIKPSQVQKLGKENGKEGIIINGQWRAKPWTNEERERYSRVSGIQQEQAKGSASGNANQRALLDMLAQAEGTSRSYGVVFGGGINRDLEQGNLTVQEVIDLGNSATTGSGATGRYQFMPSTLQGLIRNGVLKADQKFTPELQDKAALALIRGRGVDPTKPLTRDSIYRLGGEWASLEGGPQMKPGGSYSYNGRSQVKYSADQALSIYERNLKSSQSLAKPTPTPKSQASAQAAQEYAASKGKYYSSTTGKTYGSYSEALKDPEVQKGLKPERWPTDPRGWFGRRDGGIVGEIPRQTKSTDISSLESYPSYSPESGESMKVAIQPVIIKVPTPSGRNNSTDFPVAIGVNNSMSNTSKLYA